MEREIQVAKDECNAIEMIGSEKGTAGTSSSEKATDALCNECATQIVGLYSNH